MTSRLGDPFKVMLSDQWSGVLCPLPLIDTRRENMNFQNLNFDFSHLCDIKKSYQSAFVVTHSLVWWFKGSELIERE